METASVQVVRKQELRHFPYGIVYSNPTDHIPLSDDTLYVDGVVDGVTWYRFPICSIICMYADGCVSGDSLKRNKLSNPPPPRPSSAADATEDFARMRTHSSLSAPIIKK